MRAAPNRNNAANMRTPGISGQRRSTMSIPASRSWISAVRTMSVLKERRAPMLNVTRSRRASARLRATRYPA